jgi:hypothetical protein
MNAPHNRYEIEVGGDSVAGLDFSKCKVVDLTRPIGGEGEGFVYVFSGTFAECDAWLEAHPETFHPRASLGAVQGRVHPVAGDRNLVRGGQR